MAAETFNPIIGLNGADNMGGYKNRLVFIPANAVSAVPVIPSTITTDADYVTATGSFVFKDAENGKCIGFEATDATVKYSAPSQGDVEGKSFAPQGEFFRAGSKAEYAAFARKYNNTPGYLVLQDVNSGKQIMVGQPGLTANLSAEYDGGQKRADRRGMKFTFGADSVAPFIFLQTPIQIDELFAL